MGRPPKNNEPETTNAAPTPTEPPKRGKVRYFETPIDGLSVLVADNNPEGISDPGELEYVRATRYTKMFRGERVRTGLFVVDADTPPEAVKVLENDGNVTELTEAQYNAVVEDKETRLVG
jgi:hypothetical protein